MVRNIQTTTTNGLRKNRVTQKTRLRIVRGQLDADAIILDDEEERNRVLASQGVDAEDANEHHLQAVLSAANHRKYTGEKHAEAHIPTPDAAGLVDTYDFLYPPGKIQQPTTHLRFSDTVEESLECGLAGGFTYFLDERDAEWIKKNNQEARGEGTSASGSVTTNGTSIGSPVTATRSGRVTHGRGIKIKGKDPETSANTSHFFPRAMVDEDEFELVMGLLEKFTEDKFPFIHLDLEAFPPFSDYEAVFGAPLPPATFANYIVPSSVPTPDRLVLLARVVYPHWKERRLEREGKRIVPQLDYDDTQEENSYICFRRRDVKPLRRTRASSTTFTDKLLRLRSELQMGLDLAKMVMEREVLKKQTVTMTRDIWQVRRSLVDAWRSQEGTKEPGGLGSDDDLLYDKERIPVKRIKSAPQPSRIVLGANRRISGGPSGSITPQTDSHSPLTAHLDLPEVNLNTLSPVAYVAVQNAVQERYKTMQAGVEKEMASLRAADAAWEDILDMPVQPKAISHPDSLFKAFSPPSSHASPAPSVPEADQLTQVHISSSPLEPGLVPSRHTTLSMVPPPPPKSFGFTDANQSDFFDSTAASNRGPRSPRMLRLRTGRGGRLHLDRQLHNPQPHSLLRSERARWPGADSSFSGTRHEDEGLSGESRWRGRDWRPESAFAASSFAANASEQSGSGYLSLESVYTDRMDAFHKRKRDMEEEEVIGFESTVFGSELPEFAEWEKGSIKDEQWKVETRSCGIEPSSKRQKRTVQARSHEGETEEIVERARRIDEQWRYDSVDLSPEQDTRFLLDDFQPKFLRTAITLLDANDLKTLETDVKHLTLPDQLHLKIPIPKTLRQRPTPQLSSLPQTPTTSKSSNQRASSPTSSVAASPQQQQAAPITPGPKMVEEQIRRIARQPLQSPSKSPATPIPASQQTGPTALVAHQSTPTPNSSPSTVNGFHGRQTSLGTGFSGEDAATVRVSSSIRTKLQTPSLQHQATLVQTPNGFTQANGTFSPHPSQTPNQSSPMHPGHAHGLNPQQYATLRNVFGGQQQQRPQLVMPTQMHGATGNGNINLQMGPGNLNLKLPPSRGPQLRGNGNPGGHTNNSIDGSGSPIPVNISPPHPNMSSPAAHGHTSTVNGHLAPSSHGRASPTSNHFMGHPSPLGQTPMSNSPQHHQSLVALPLHATTPRRLTPTYMHQQMVGAAGQGHEYS